MAKIYDFDPDLEMVHKKNEEFFKNSSLFRPLCYNPEAGEIIYMTSDWRLVTCNECKKLRKSLSKKLN